MYFSNQNNNLLGNGQDEGSHEHFKALMAVSEIRQIYSPTGITDLASIDLVRLYSVS